MPKVGVTPTSNTVQVIELQPDKDDIGSKADGVRSTKTIFFIRHGQSTFNARIESCAVRATCRCCCDPMIRDAPLTDPKGHRQVDSLHEFLKEQPWYGLIDKAFVSPLTRAMQTLNGGFRTRLDEFEALDTAEELPVTVMNSPISPSKLHAEYSNKKKNQKQDNNTNNNNDGNSNNKIPISASAKLQVEDSKDATALTEIKYNNTGNNNKSSKVTQTVSQEGSSAVNDHAHDNAWVTSTPANKAPTLSPSSSSSSSSSNQEESDAEGKICGSAVLQQTLTIDLKPLDGNDNNSTTTTTTTAAINDNNDMNNHSNEQDGESGAVNEHDLILQSPTSPAPSAPLPNTIPSPSPQASQNKFSSKFPQPLSPMPEVNIHNDRNNNNDNIEDKDHKDDNKNHAQITQKQQNTQGLTRLDVSVSAACRESRHNLCDEGRSPQELKKEFPLFKGFEQLKEIWWYQGNQNRCWCCRSPIDILCCSEPSIGVRREPHEAVERRAAEFADMLFNYPSKMLAVVAHGDFIRTITKMKKLPNCGVIRIEMNENGKLENGKNIFFPDV